MTKEENYWLATTNEENYEIIKDKKIWGVKHRHRKQIERTEIGDKIVFYITGKKLGGIFEVASDTFSDNKFFKGRSSFPRRVEVKELAVPDQLIDWTGEIIGNLNFITNKKRWHLHLFGQATTKLPPEDYEYLKKVIEDAMTNPPSG